VDFPAIISALRRIGYEGYLMIEGFGYSPQVKTVPEALWADISASPEEIAANGARYLNDLPKAPPPST